MYKLKSGQEPIIYKRQDGRLPVPSVKRCCNQSAALYHCNCKNSDNGLLSFVSLWGNLALFIPYRQSNDCFDILYIKGPSDFFSEGPLLVAVQFMPAKLFDSLRSKLELSLYKIAVIQMIAGNLAL